VTAAPLPLPDRPRLGFVGVGWIGRNRLEAIARSGCAEVAAITDLSAEVAAEAARLAPGARVLPSLDELLAADLDGVVIASPSALHAAQAQAALERGWAVFCQKPLGRDAAETRAVVAAARRADRLLAVDLSYRFTAAGQALRELVQSGELGEVYALDLVFHNAYGPDKPWFYDRRLSGGGCLIDLGIHLVDLALWSLGFPAVQAVTSSLFSGGRPLAPGQVEDFAAAQLVLAGGAVVQLACSWKLPAGCDAVIEASFYGTRGGASLRNVGGSFYDFVCERFEGTTRHTLTAPPDPWPGRAAVDWARRLAAGERFDDGADRLVTVAEVLDRTYAATATNAGQPGLKEPPSGMT
jgi:predicted dehydrogenase